MKEKKTTEKYNKSGILPNTYMCIYRSRNFFSIA